MDGSCIVHSQRFEGIVHNDRLLAVVAVRTVPGRFRLLNDEQLLQLVSPHTAFLVGQGASEHLVFLNPEDRDGFPATDFQ